VRFKDGKTIFHTDFVGTETKSVQTYKFFITPTITFVKAKKGVFSYASFWCVEWGFWGVMIGYGFIHDVDAMGQKLENEFPELKGLFDNVKK
jgi:hypothetical protein